MSTQLSVRGRAKCRLLRSEADGNEGGAADPILLVEVLAGIGGLRKALELLGVIPQGIVLIESDALCIKLAKRHCAYVLVVNDVKSVTRDMVKGWRSQFNRAQRVLVGGGWPCINHSSLNKSRAGASASSSLLLDDMLQVSAWLKVVSDDLRLPPWLEFYENVVMDQDDLQIQSQKIGILPIMQEAADCLWCRRPRLYWIKGLEVLEGQDGKLLKEPNRGGVEHEAHSLQDQL